MFKGKINQNPRTCEKAFTIEGREAQSKTTPKCTVQEKSQNTALVCFPNKLLLSTLRSHLKRCIL